LKLGTQIDNGFAVALAAMAVSTVVICPKVTQMMGIHGEISTL
jgi:hypothetical protein